MKVYVKINDFYDLLKGSDDPVFLKAIDFETDSKEIILEMSYAQYRDLLNQESPGCFQVDCKDGEGRYDVNSINRLWAETSS